MIFISILMLGTLLGLNDMRLKSRSISMDRQFFLLFLDNRSTLYVSRFSRKRRKSVVVDIFTNRPREHFSLFINFVNIMTIRLLTCCWCIVEICVISRPVANV